MNPAVHALPLWLDILITALLVVGAAFTLVGSWGLARLSDFLKRLHGPTKATTLGVGCVLLASSLYFSAGAAPSLREFLIMMFLFMTAPVSAHMLVKALLKQQPALRPPLPSAASAGSDAERVSG
ncbi:MAG: Na+/H+ antiporter subunit G [Gammaproteobacteria bacterium]